MLITGKTVQKRECILELSVLSAQLFCKSKTVLKKNSLLIEKKKKKKKKKGGGDGREKNPSYCKFSCQISTETHSM